MLQISSRELALLPTSAPPAPSTSPPSSTLISLLEPSLWTPWPSGKARHALTGHLHEGINVHLANIDALSHHLLHHHLHLLLLGGHGPSRRAIVASWSRHRSTAHHLLELLQLRLTLLVGVDHGHLALAICFPGELVETVVEVV